MQLNLKIVLAASTIIGTAAGLTSLANAAPAGLNQAAPAIQSAVMTDEDQPKIENVWWRRYHRWHHWHHWHHWHRW
jgi:hypothetical protein